MSNDQTKITTMKALIVDAEGTVLTREEEQLFQSEKPAGFILFKRNCVSRKQVKELVIAMRTAAGRNDIPILIDQEGGTVSRLKEPEWKEYPTARSFGEMPLEKGYAAAQLNAYLMAQDLSDLGITVNCAPVVDVPTPECHAFLAGNRTYGDDAETVKKLGEAVCRGLLKGGVIPVLKHIPGHGRAAQDSHFELPRVDVDLGQLLASDVKPFKYLAQSDMKTALWAMAAHVVYSALDPDSAASLSRTITQEIVRREIVFEGVLIADDISMKALSGTLESRVKDTLAAGMDLTMLCNASLEERALALSAAPKVSAVSAWRIENAERQRAEFMRQFKKERESSTDERSRSAGI